MNNILWQIVLIYYSLMLMMHGTPTTNIIKFNVTKLEYNMGEILPQNVQGEINWS